MTHKSAYFHCIGGASGDMILGALVDAGVALDELERELGKLDVAGFSLSQRTEQRGGLRGTLVSVTLDDEGRKPRCWQDFVDIIECSSLKKSVVERARRVFRRLAEAEAHVHGASTEEVQLHELGEVDTLVDVVGSVVGLDLLGIEGVYCSAFPSGSGVVETAHGVMPVPAPATAALFALAAAPVVPPPGNHPDTGEMVTPTGAAILTTLATFSRPSMRVERVGYGLGSRDPSRYPNALALWLGRGPERALVSDLTLVETNIDDMSPELLGFVQERLFELGARDVWFTPIQMKKNRPASMLSAIVSSDLESRAVALIMTETTTLGVRVRPVERYEADREVVEVETSLGPVEVKLKSLDGRAVAVSPEYEACRRIALKRGLPLQEVYRTVQREAEARFLSPYEGPNGGRIG